MRFQVKPTFRLKQGPVKTFISQKSAIAKLWKYPRPVSTFQLLSEQRIPHVKREHKSRARRHPWAP